jgi:hypothetical protein
VGVFPLWCMYYMLLWYNVFLCAGNLPGCTTCLAKLPALSLSSSYYGLVLYGRQLLADGVSRLHSLPSASPLLCLSLTKYIV